jgi:hypothetical protein
MYNVEQQQNSQAKYNYLFFSIICKDLLTNYGSQKVSGTIPLLGAACCKVYTKKQKLVSPRKTRSSRSRDTNGRTLLKLFGVTNEASVVKKSSISYDLMKRLIFSVTIIMPGYIQSNC